MKKTIIVGGSLKDAGARVADAWRRAERGEPVEPEDHVTFVSWSALASRMTDKRYELLRRLHRQPAVSVRALARDIGRTSSGTRTRFAPRSGSTRRRSAFWNRPSRPLHGALHESSNRALCTLRATFVFFVFILFTTKNTKITRRPQGLRVSCAVGRRRRWPTQDMAFPRSRARTRNPRPRTCPFQKAAKNFRELPSGFQKTPISFHFFAESFIK
jgi:hypothetical protein